jgi:hypothetical protein
MASEIEVERLIVRLLGDGSQFQKMLMTAQQSAVSSAQAIQRAAADIQTYQDSINKFASTAVGALGSLGILRFLDSARSAYEEVHLASMKLTSAIEMNGGVVSEVTADYEEFAKSLASVTSMTKQEILSNLSMAESMGMTGDAAKAVVKNMLSITAGARHLRGGWMAMSAAIELSQGHWQQAAHIMGVPRELMHNETAALAELVRRLGGSWEKVLIQGQLNNSVWKRLSNTFFELKVEIGKVLSEHLRPLLEVLETWANAFKELDSNTKGLIIAIAVLGATLLAVRPLMWLADPVYNLAAGFVKLAYSLVLTTAQLVIMGTLKVISLTLWIAWSAVVILAKGAMLLFNVQLAIHKGLWWLSTSGMVLYKLVMIGLTPVILACKAAIILFNLAMAAASIAGVVQLVAGITMIIGILVIAKAAFIAVMATVAVVKDAFHDFLIDIRAFSGVTGPLSRVLTLFEGMGSVISSAFSALKRGDFKGLWKLAQVAFEVFMARIQDLWPPLWAYIQSGWTAMWNYLYDFTRLTVKMMAVEIRKELSLANPFISEKDKNAILESSMKAMEIYGEARDKVGGTFSEKMRTAAMRFELAMIAGPSDAVKAAEAKLTVAMAAIGIKSTDWAKDLAGSIFGPLGKVGVTAFTDLYKLLTRKAFNVGSGIGGNIAHGFQSIKLNAILYDSVEALAAFMESSEQIKHMIASSAKTGGTPTVPPGVPGGPAVAGETLESIDTFKKSVDAFGEWIKKLIPFGSPIPGIDIKPAEFGRGA